MTKEQADQIIALLMDIREQVARQANTTAKDNSFVFYGRPVTTTIDPNRPQTT